MLAIYHENADENQKAGYHVAIDNFFGHFFGVNKLRKGATEQNRQHKTRHKTCDAANNRKERDHWRHDKAKFLKNLGKGGNDIVCPHSKIVGVAFFMCLKSAF